MTPRPVVTERRNTEVGERWMPERLSPRVIVLRECPDGLYPGPIEDGVQTYYGAGRNDVPKGWEYRYWSGDESYDVVPRGAPWAGIVQCRPPVEPEPRTTCDS